MHARFLIDEMPVKIFTYLFMAILLMPLSGCTFITLHPTTSVVMRPTEVVVSFNKTDVDDLFALESIEELESFYGGVFAQAREELGVPAISGDAVFTKSFNSLYEIRDGDLRIITLHITEHRVVEEIRIYKDVQKSEHIRISANFSDGEDRTSEANYYHQEKNISKNEMLAILKQWGSGK